MPLPLLFLGAAAIIGGGKTIKAGVDSKRAREINSEAEDLIEEAKKRINDSREACNDSLENLGKLKISVLDQSMNRFVDCMDKVANFELTESKGINELNNLKLEKKDYKDLKNLGSVASSMLAGGAAGVAGGALAAFGAYSAVATFATASTGTAIASLSGVAASNATLAFLGGGTAAAGAGGIAGGMAVLGGLVAGPALLITGFVTGSKAKANLDRAYSNKAEAEKISEELGAGADQCDAIRRRTYMIYVLLARLDAIFLPIVLKMEDVIRSKGTDYSSYSKDERAYFAAGQSVAGSIKAILDTTILNENGQLADESQKVIDSTTLYLSSSSF